MKAKLPLLFIAAGLLAACGTTPNTGSYNQRELLHTDAQNALAQFKATDMSLEQKLDGAYAYAIFPNVVTAAVGVGGAHGNGEVYQNGRLIGYADLSQGNIGVQLGGQKYAELVLFQNDRSLSDFQHSTVEFDARASAVAAKDGAASAADYTNGVLVFALPQGGLMFQAAIGGQKFRYESANTNNMPQ
jgi:lipid-binding SYLF domain-containing protein